MTRQNISRSAAKVLAHLVRSGATARLQGDGLIISSSVDGESATTFSRRIAEQLFKKKLLHLNANGLVSLTAFGEEACRDIAIEPPELFVPDEFRAQHEGLSKQKPISSSQPVYYNVAESPLLWMRRRKGADGEPLIGAAAFAAGERLRQDYTLSCTAPRMGIDWSNPLAGSGRNGPGGLNATDTMIAAKQRMNEALQAVGPEFSGLLFDLCCFLKGLEQIERERRWPIRSAKVVAGLALERLARHYGFSDETRGRDRSGPIRAWSTADSATDD